MFFSNILSMLLIYLGIRLVLEFIGGLMYERELRLRREARERAASKGGEGSPSDPPHTLHGMRVLLNLIWLVFSGLWMALAYAAVGVIFCITIIGIPFGIASFRIGLYALWPFGHRVVTRSSSGVGSLIGNVLWLVLAGWWLALGHLATGILMCLTIIGIPLGLASFKLIPVSLMPLGKEIR